MRDPSRLGTERIGKLLRELAVPAMVASLVQALYNVVDRLYIGHIADVGKEALAGLALTFPYMMILASFGTLIGVGTGALVSIRLGEGDSKQAEKLLGQCVAVKILFFITIPVAAYFTLDRTLIFFGGNADTIPYARDYLRIILLGNIFSHLSFGLSAQMRAEGNGNKAMICMIIGAVANIALDPLFIFVFGMGIKGAAHATNLAMFLACCYAFRHFTGGRSAVPLRLRNIRIFPAMIPAVFAIGLSPFILQLVSSAVQVLFNRGFRIHAPDKDAHTLAVAAFIIVNSVIVFILMPIFGIAQGMQPIVGYNFGAKRYGRVAKAWRLAIIYSSALCVAGTLTSVVFAAPLARCFTSDPEMLKLSRWAMRVCCLGLPFVGVGIMSTSYYQSVGKAKKAIVLSLTRQVLMLIPLIWFLPKIFEINGIWFAGPVSDTLSAVLMSTVAWYEFRHLRRLREKTETETAKIETADIETSALMERINP